MINMQIGFKESYVNCRCMDSATITDQHIGLGIRRVIFNDPATIVLWQDGTKTVVDFHDEPFDAEKGLAMAILKKLCGKAQLRKEFKKWITQN